MADVEQSQTSASDAAAAADKPVIDMENVTLEQLDDLLGKGTATLPMVVNREEKAGASGATGPAASGPAESGAPAETGATGPAESGAPAETGATGPAETGPAETGPEETGATGPEETGATGPEASGATGPAASGPKEESDRFRYSDPTDRAVNALYRARKEAGKPISWAEAERLVVGETSGASGPPAVEEIDYDKVVGALETEVTDIKKKLDDAGANEGVFDANISKLTQDLAEKTADLKLAKRDQRIANAQAEAESRRQAEQSAEARAKAKATALEQFPDAGDDSKPLGKAVAERIAQMKDPNHPDHSILYADSAPLTIVRDVASELGIQPVAKKKAAAPPATPPPVTPPAAPPKSKVSPPSGAKTSVPAVLPQEDAKKYVEHLKSPAATLEELDAVFEPGGQQKTLATVVGR